MPLRIVPFEPSLLPAVRRFSEQTWSRPNSEAFYRWRYLECPSLIGLLALNGEDCVACLWAFQRPYLFAGRGVTCLETHDWFCRPDLRGSGVGVRLMQSMMARPEPIVAIGNGPETLALLPRMKWRSAGEFSLFALPLGGRALAAYLARRSGLPVPGLSALYRAAVRPWIVPRAPGSPAGGTVEEAREIGTELLDESARAHANGMFPLPDPQRIAWLMNAPADVGHFELLRYRIHGRIVGWSLTRLHRGPHGLEGTLVDAIAPQGDQASRHWILATALARLAARDPDMIRAATSWPALADALRAGGFRSYQSLPILVWPHAEAIPPSPHEIANSTADMPFSPYSER